nr:MAG TPA: hypothetical protein [Caudoviricetes sp.]DAK79111.1 MAG TPA: hypothetical protein [Caudoviricetes sp.]
MLTTQENIVLDKCCQVCYNTYRERVYQVLVLCVLGFIEISFRFVENSCIPWRDGVQLFSFIGFLI